MFRWIYAMVVATGLALALVWQGAGMREDGYAVARLQKQISDQKAQTAMLETHLSKLKSPQRVTTLVAYLGLNLQPPVPAAEPARPLDSGTVSVAAATGF